MKSIAVSNKMLAVAQASYEGNPDYGLTDDDMRKAIKAALNEAPDQQAEIARLSAQRVRLSEQYTTACRIIEKMATKRDQAQARAAAATMEMRERAASVTVDLGPRYDGRPVHYHIPENVKSVIRALPIDPDAQKALDQMLAKAREDAIREALETFRAQIESMRQNVGDWSISEVPEAVNDTLDDILALLNDGEDDGKTT